MCGVVGIFSSRPINQDVYDALTILQHRGQDAAGLMVSDGRHVLLQKAGGLVREAIRQPHIAKLQGNLGVGHVRYPTAGSDSPKESQPFYVNSPYGLGLVHNGNLTNTIELRETIIRTDLRHLDTSSDSELLLNVVAHELQRVGQPKLLPQQLEQALANVYRRVEGAFSAVMMIHGYGLVGFRDAHAIRPLVYGKRDNDGAYMFASESVALDALGFNLLGDVGPGEAIYITAERQIHRFQCAEPKSKSPCLFEYIYLARPDSIIDGISVYQARLEMGKQLASQIEQRHPAHGIDVVIPIPDTSRTAALALAQKLGVPYSEGFVKNHYIGRTFIMPGQVIRQSSVKLKLNPIKAEFFNKSVLLVDDSLVRGTTSKGIVQMAKEAGARRVYFASAAPAVRYPNVYGIDMPTAEELIAAQKSEEEIATLLGVDWIVYQDIQDVRRAILSASNMPSTITTFEDSIFTGHYLTGNISAAYLQALAESRNDAQKEKKRLLDYLDV